MCLCSVLPRYPLLSTHFVPLGLHYVMPRPSSLNNAYVLMNDWHVPL